jgi:CRP/FNR family transcriptional regulator, carbon monoxide oxidation system transcription regulator
MKTLGIDLLTELERPELATIRNSFRQRSFPKGVTIYRADEPQNLVFVIRSGRVRVFLAYEEKEFTLAILGKGDIYATHAGTAVQTLEDTELLVAGVEAVRRGLTDVPEFTKTMVRILGNILKSTFSIIGSLAFKDIYKRLVDLLLEQSEERGEVTDEGVVVRLDLSMEQLSQLIGASRQTTSTLLNEMIRTGIVEKRSRGVYLIPDLQALKHAAE